MPDVLVVPVQLDALCLGRETDVVEARADFTRLPYVDPVTGADVRPDAAYLSEQVLPTPFEDQNLRLRPGVHLHWSLPDALTRLVQRDGATSVPSVPNRWLVTRTVGGRIDAQWVVESDYLDTGGAGGVYPVDEPVPFRFLGRRMPLSAWRPGQPGDRVPVLTAVGYGEPTFAAFYPNCHSVFGLHDPDYPETPPKGLAYDVVGWFDDFSQDPLSRVTGGDWVKKVEDGFGWTVPKTDDRQPHRMVCYARLVFDPAAETASPLLADGESGVCVGNTATGALAAHLGSVMPGLEPDEAEDLLEALAFAADLESRAVDVGVKLAEARHSDTFRALPSGALWTIRRQDGPDPAPEQRQAREALSLPHEAGDRLNALNQAQEAHDRALEAATSLREQLFADWYKYQLCVYPQDQARDGYPDPDEVRAFLERQMRALATLQGSINGQLAGEVKMTYEALAITLSAFESLTSGPLGVSYVIEQGAAPSFHQPAEPVVLLTGRAATPSDRYGMDGEDQPDGLLPCRVVPVPDLNVPADVQRRVAPLGLGGRTWQHQPWHPVLLQWEAEFFPASLGDNLDSGDRDYAASYLEDNYTLEPGIPDLSARPGRDIPDKAANIYTGTTVVSQGARPVLASRVLRYLAGALLDSYNAAAETKVGGEAFLKQPQPVLDWYAAHGTQPRLKTLIAIHAHLAEHEHSNLSQALSGFNDALLMRHLTRQLPVADPLGFPAYQRFAADVAAAVGGDTRHAPRPDSDFNPIRAGALRVLRLRVVDNYGIAVDVDTSAIATTTQLRVEGHPQWVAMPPRLTQPSRLHARWLDSDHDLREMNDVPVTSPVCGWILPDDLDLALAVHAADGSPLGLLSAVADPRDPLLARWSGDRPLAEIANPHLRTVAGWLAAQGPERLAELLGDLDTVLTRIEPEDTAAGILTGRPLAVVRAELDLQLRGLSAVHQDWNVFRQDMRRTSRESNAFPQVRFPVRIGDHDLLDDGLVGLWEEDFAAFTLTTAQPQVSVALATQARVLTMLVDPRAPVHARSGILPVKQLRIPPGQYRQALDGMRVSLFVAPVLTDGDHLGMPLPAVPGQTWTWAGVPVDVLRADAAFPAPPTLREGRLTLEPERGTP
jgi:hypothetical protein